MRRVGELFVGQNFNLGVSSILPNSFDFKGKDQGNWNPDYRLIIQEVAESGAYHQSKAESFHLNGDNLKETAG